MNDKREQKKYFFFLALKFVLIVNVTLVLFFEPFVNDFVIGVHPFEVVFAAFNRLIGRSVARGHVVLLDKPFHFIHVEASISAAQHALDYGAQ